LLIIRSETPEDRESIGYVNEQAFGRANEAWLVEKLREHGALTVSLVAVQGGEVVGHIAFSPAIVESEYSRFEALTLGPIAVLPAHQRKGIGTKLVSAGLEECRRLGHDLVVLVGHPEYYPRFGFVTAGPRGIACEFEEAPEEAWMVLELRPGALAGKKGTARFRPEFREAM